MSKLLVLTVVLAAALVGVAPVLASGVCPPEYSGQSLWRNGQEYVLPERGRVVGIIGWGDMGVGDHGVCFVLVEGDWSQIAPYFLAEDVPVIPEPVPVVTTPAPQQVQPDVANRGAVNNIPIPAQLMGAVNGKLKAAAIVGSAVFLAALVFLSARSQKGAEYLPTDPRKNPLGIFFGISLLLGGLMFLVIAGGPTLRLAGLFGWLVFAVVAAPGVFWLLTSLTNKGVKVPVPDSGVHRAQAQSTIRLILLIITAVCVTAALAKFGVLF